MKHFFIVLVVLSFSLANAQFYEGTIYLKDSTEIKGLIKAKTFGGLKYKESESSDIKEFEDNQLSGYDIKEDGTIDKYRFKDVQGVSRKMKIVRLGKINLYSIFVSNSSTAMGMGLPTSSGNVYFLEKNNITIRTGVKFKNGKLHLIEDCPMLIDKIEKKEFNKREIIKIIEYYNKSCI
ncbi:hypothetical protein ACFQ1R_06560 [Mariniflexile jejuense]|uniref:Uncharacterized protein n=1 Tax=Mariniflexile jejuense TaxID=1173582 RepID=A0ABW3JIV5_9FLAO